MRKAFGTASAYLPSDRYPCAMMLNLKQRLRFVCTIERKQPLNPGESFFVESIRLCTQSTSHDSHPRRWFGSQPFHPVRGQALHIAARIAIASFNSGPFFSSFYEFIIYLFIFFFWDVTNHGHNKCAMLGLVDQRSFNGSKGREREREREKTDWRRG